MKNNLLLWISIVLFFTLTSGTKEKVVFETTYFKVGIDSKGFINSFVDKKTSTEYFPKGVSAPLLALCKDSVYIKPVSAVYSASDKKITLKYPNGSLAIISVANKKDYLRFELLSLEPRNGVGSVVWGPYPTTINEKIGETIGVVRNQQFAIGMQGLNIKTIEGIPYGDDAGGCIIDPLPGQKLPDSLKNMVGKKVDVNVNVTGDMPDYVRMYRGCAAMKKSYGSELRLFARDYRIPRVITAWESSKELKQYVEPINVDFVGTSIALFGCPSDITLDIIEKIELAEGLPHPLLNGVWLKRSTIPGQAYLLNEGDPALSIKYAKACGFKLIHLGDFFQSWGHFGLNTQRFNGAEGIKKATDAAKKEGVSLGVHTLTMFTGTNDSYVSPIPSDSLCKTGSSVLTKDISKDDDVIYIKDPIYFRNLGNTHTVKIGKELINFRKVSDEEPWRLIDCKRAQYSTTAGSFKTGTTIDKLTNNCYGGFYPDIYLQDKFAKRLADVCNTTGIDLMDFDGYGGGSPTGHENYGAGRFIEMWYKNLDRYRLTCGAGAFHYSWHIVAFMNWGEPWYNSLRESQVNYRIENQRYFDRNLMPGMLGWFTLNTEFRPEEVEWIQARSAAFNAGYLLRVDESIEKNGYKDQLFEEIREWQKARRANAFTSEQKERMKNPKNEFHLEKRGENSWDLYPVKLSRGYQHKFRDVQTGEPVASKFVVNNPYQEQPLQFYITVQAVDNDLSATVSHIQFKINNYQTIELNTPLKAGDRVCCDGQKVYLCDKTWNKLSVISTNKVPVCERGNVEIVVTSEFSGSKSPNLGIEFKSVGMAEKVVNEQSVSALKK
jgi:hypothetical protein